MSFANQTLILKGNHFLLMSSVTLKRGHTCTEVFRSATRESMCVWQAIFAINMFPSSWLSSREGSDAAFYLAQKIVKKIRHWREPLWTHQKSQWQTVFTMLASMQSIWYRCHPSPWALQGKRCKDKSLQSRIMGKIKLTSWALKQEEAVKFERNTVTKWFQPYIRELSFSANTVLS